MLIYKRSANQSTIRCVALILRSQSSNDSTMPIQKLFPKNDYTERAVSVLAPPPLANQGGCDCPSGQGFRISGLQVYLFHLYHPVAPFKNMCGTKLILCILHHHRYVFQFCIDQINKCLFVMRMLWGILRRKILKKGEPFNQTDSGLRTDTRIAKNEIQIMNATCGLRSLPQFMALRFSLRNNISVQMSP